MRVLFRERWRGRASTRCRHSRRHANRPPSNPELARRYPLALLSPPARNALNSTFANLPLFLDTEKTPWLDMHPDDARARGIAAGDQVRAFNDRGALVLTARVSDRPRPGVVVALSIWWRKLSPDGNNANMLTGQALTDMGRAATFYDTLVEVERLPSAPRRSRSAELQSSNS